MKNKLGHKVKTSSTQTLEAVIGQRTHKKTPHLKSDIPELTRASLFE
jgi:hypothetical protein